MARSVRAKVHNQTSFEEGAAGEELAPGQGCVIEEDEDGSKTVRAANADEQTTRVVREPRNPPRFDTEVDHPLGHAYGEGDNVETIGFLPFDQFRGVLSDGGEGDEVGWNADGELTATEVGSAIGRVRKVIDDVDDTVDYAVVEVL